MVRVDHGLRVGQIREWVLHDLGEARTALRLVRHREVHACSPGVLLCLRLQVLATREVELDLGALLLLLVVIEGLLIDLVKVFIHDIVIVDCLRDFNEVDLLEVLIEKLFSIFLEAGPLQGAMHLSVDLLVIGLPRAGQDCDSFRECYVLELAYGDIESLLVAPDPG